MILKKAYNGNDQQQLEEILSNPLYGNKGKFVEIWMDGAWRPSKAPMSLRLGLRPFVAIKKDAVIFPIEATGIALDWQ